MTIEYLKRGKSDAERGEDDAKTRQVVEATLKEIEVKGDAAVRALSEKFDGYSPQAFRLSQAEIDDLIPISNKLSVSVFAESLSLFVFSKKKLFTA